MSVLNIFNKTTKEGPGVAKEETPKRPLFKYWELFFRKFWSIVTLNMIFVLCILPFGGLSYLIYYLLSSSQSPIILNPILFGIVVMAPFMFIGPIVAATHKITREFAREIPVMIWGDFFSCLKKNIKQPIIFSILSYIILSCLINAIPSYYSSYATNSNIFYLILFGICVFCLVIFLFIQYYIYHLAVTCDLTVFQILKNSLILAIVSLWKNLIITLQILIYVGIIVLSLLFTSTVIVLLPLLLMFFVLLAFGWLSFTNSFISFPVIKKYILDPYYEEIEENTDNSENNRQLEPNENSEYVYQNGRMVLRSSLEQEQLFQDSTDKTHK